MTFRMFGTTRFLKGMTIMFKHEKVLWITRTAFLTGLTVVSQFMAMQIPVPIPMGTQIITGSIVNLMLIIAVMTCGLPTGLTVSAFTPVLPTLIGFGPVWPVVPFIAAGNMVLVTAWHFIGNRKIVHKYVSYGLAMIAGAVAKFLVLYLGIVKIAVPFILGLPEGNVLSIMFSYPQLVTAGVGGGCAVVLLPLLLKAVRQQS